MSEGNVINFSLLVFINEVYHIDFYFIYYYYFCRGLYNKQAQDYHFLFAGGCAEDSVVMEWCEALYKYKQK